MFVCVMAALTLTAQQVGQNTQAANESTPTFKTGAQLVVENVVVTDKKGNPIEGLTAKDFAVTENGVPQTIRFFEYQKLSDSQPAPQTEPELVHIYDKLGRMHISAEAPGSTKYKDRR